MKTFYAEYNNLGVDWYINNRSSIYLFSTKKDREEFVYKKNREAGRIVAQKISAKEAHKTGNFKYAEYENED